MSREMNCFEAIGELDAAMSDVVPRGMDYIVLGGIASSALQHPGTRFEKFPVGGMVCAQDEAAEPVIRDNKTKRDVDVLVTGVLDDETSQKIKSTVAEATEGNLLVSVFDFDQHDPNPSLVKKAKAGVSHRTIDESGVLRYEMYPLEQVVGPETYEPWQLMTPSGLRVNILHPVGHMLAYKMRSISGIRTKDEEKIAKMTQNVLAVPELREAMYEGPFIDWLAFAEGIQRILNGRMEPGDGMLAPGTSRAALAAFRWKGKLLHIAESNPLIVKLAQDEESLFQKALNTFVRAK